MDKVFIIALTLPSYIVTKIASQMQLPREAKRTGSGVEMAAEKRKTLKERRKHQLLIYMPQLSSTSKYPCHLGDKEEEVGREKLHPLMLTDKDRQLNKEIQISIPWYPKRSPK